MNIDSHQHFWSYSPAEYPWITDRLQLLRRDYLPSDLEPELVKAKLDRCVAVQARQSMTESRWLLTLADHASIIHSVVGWVDLRAPHVGEQLAELAQHPKFIGVRHVVQDEPDDRFLVQPNFIRGLKQLKQHRLTYDLLIFPKQLPAAIELVKQLPDQPFVLDHIVKPLVRDSVISPWREQIRELAQHKNVWCKVSGLVTEAKWDQWQRQDFRPYLDVIFEAFDEDRLMYGSDWPVCLLAGSYQAVHGLAEDYVRQLTPQAREKFWGANAGRFYRR